MSDPIKPEDILIALEEIKSELPFLLGPDNWSQVNDVFTKQLKGLKQSTDDLERKRLSANLVSLLMQYENSHERLMEILRVEGERKREHESLKEFISKNLSIMATKIQVDSNIVEPSISVVIQSVEVEFVDTKITCTENNIRWVTIPAGGIDKAKSIKIKNLKFDLDILSELVAGVVMTFGDKVIGKTSPILIAGGLLLIVGSLVKNMTVEISEKEASVFWGFIKARDKNNFSDESSILKHTNEERGKIGLDTLTKNQVKNSLHKLALLRSIEIIDPEVCKWHIIERYKIQG